MKISRIELYHPETMLAMNTTTTLPFFKYGMDKEQSRHILEYVLCRDKRYGIEKNLGENSMTVIVKAAKKNSICFDINFNCTGIPFCVNWLSHNVSADHSIKRYEQ